MKKYILILFSFFLVLFTLSSCKDSFLDEKNYSAYTTQTLADSLGFEAAAIGLYNQFSQILTTSNAQGFLCIWQTGTDIAYSPSNTTQGIERPYFTYAQLNNQDAGAGFVWQWAYLLIGDANVLIQMAEAPSVKGMTQANQNKLNGEARFFRAYAYNYLATCFGGVPIITKPLTAPKTDFVRAPLDTVNALIEKDLLYAATYLPNIEGVSKPSGGSKLYGRAHKEMAQQLLAEVYLRMNKPALAQAQCQAIIDGNQFKLNTTRFGVKASSPGDPFSDMFILGNQRRKEGNAGNQESIWVLENENPVKVPGGQTNSPQQRRVWGAAYYNKAGMALADSIGGRGIARLRLNNWVLYSLYGPGDMRNSRFNIRRRYVYNDPASAYAANYGKLVPYAGADTTYFLCPSTTKWGEFDPDNPFGFGHNKDFTIMRYGETFLLKAEAQFKQGDLPGAMATLNIIRGRANASLITDPNTVTLDFILDERARELLAEENRRLTLMRTGTLVTRANSLNKDAGSGINTLSGLTNTHLLLPIPKTEIDLNKDAVIDQNPGY